MSGLDSIAPWPPFSHEVPIEGVRQWDPSDLSLERTSLNRLYLWDPQTEEFQTRFRALVEQWREETAFTSSLTGMIAHPAYLQVIALGNRVAPLLLEEMRQRPDHWHWALAAVTGDDPVAPEDRGDLDAVVRAWTEWGRRRWDPRE